MVKYFCNTADIRSTWDHVVSAFWQRYPNPFSTHVLTEDVVYREVTADNRLLSRRLLMKTNRMPRWAEFLFPTGMSRSVYIVEDSIVDPVNRSLTTYTWNLNHTTLMTCLVEHVVHTGDGLLDAMLDDLLDGDLDFMSDNRRLHYYQYSYYCRPTLEECAAPYCISSVEERCIFRDSVEQPATTQLKREAWISSGVYGFSRPIQEFGLARFKSNQVKAMKGLEYALSNLQGETPQRLLRDTVKDASEKAKEAAKSLASAAAVPQKPQQYV